MVLLATTLLALPACRHKATFEENYSGAIENIKKGKWELARGQLNRAYLQSPNNIETKYQLAMVEVKLQDERSAYSLLREAEEKDHQRSSVSVPVRIELAKLFIGSKMFDQAQQRLLWVLEKEPQNKEARTLLAADLAYMAQPDAAKEQVDLLLAENPADPSGRVLDVALHLAAHEAQLAEESLQEEVNLTKRSTDSLVALANFYRLTRQQGKAIALLSEVLQREPQNIPVRMQLGWAYAQSGEQAAAEKTFREMAQIAPSNPAAAMALTNYYMNLSDWPKAAAELEPLVKKNPDANSRGLLAAVYYRGGRRADAKKLADQLIQENNRDANAHLLSGLLRMDAREYDLAAADFDHVLSYQADSAAAQYFLALAAYGAGKEHVAQQEMEQALKLNRALLPARLWLMDYHLRHGSKEVVLNLVRQTPEGQLSTPEVVVANLLCNSDTDLSPEQQNELQRALLARPSLIMSYPNQGMTKLLRKYGSSLRAQLEAAVKKNPQLRAAQALLLTVLEAEGKQDQALAQVQRQVTANPKSPVDLLTLARLQIERGDLAGARTTLGKAGAIQPDNPEVMARMAVVEADSGDLNSALTHLNTLTERYPKFSEGWSFKAIVYQQRGNADDARKNYEQALKLDSRNAVAANNLAWLLASSFQDPQHALELARQAQAADPANPEFSDTLGWIAYQMHNYPDALQTLGDAVRMKPQDAGFRYHLGMAQSRAGRDKEALASLETALRLNPKLLEAREIRTEVEALYSRAGKSSAVR